MSRAFITYRSEVRGDTEARGRPRSNRSAENDTGTIKATSSTRGLFVERTRRFLM